MKKNIIKCISFIAILLILLVVLSYIVVPKNNAKEFGMQYVQAHGILGEKDNTIDVLVVGDSQAYASIIPMELWKEYGFTTYVCATPAQYLSETLKYAYKTLEHQKPKMIILEASAIYRSMPLSSPILEIVNEILPIVEYHNRWKNLNSNDFFGKIDYTWTDDMKGYNYKTDEKPADTSNYMTYTEDVEAIPKVNKIYMKLLKKYCELNDIPLFLISVPSPENWNYAKHNGMEAFAKQEGLEYIDMNLKKEVNIDWKKDTIDKGDHLNHKGALKVTKYFGKYLNDKNMLANHKKDEKYHKWDESLERYEEKVKEHKERKPRKHQKQQKHQHQKHEKNNM